MDIRDHIDTLLTKASAVGESLPIEWIYPSRVPRKPLQARPRASWKVWEPREKGSWAKNGPNWFYATVEFPQTRYGLPLANREALCFVSGWMPFTLWIDGKEIWKEEHAWKATGPIADPFPFPIEPGRPYRFVARVVPTELPGNTISLNVRLVPRHCFELQVDLQAVAAQLQMATALAETEADRELVQGVATEIDLEALSANRWPAVLDSVQRMEQALLPLSPRAKSLTVHAIGHAHIDMDWKWTWDDTVHCVRRDLKAVTDLMDSDDQVRFTHSQVPTYNAVKEEDPEVFDKVLSRVREGRWENAAGTWVEGDLNMADGESIARHMLYAKQWTREHLDSEATVLWEPDTFGHPGNLPQLARLGEFESYFHMRCHPDKGHDLKPIDPAGPAPPSPIREWVGVDGSRIPAFSVVYNADLHPTTVADRALRAWQNGFVNAILVWGIGDHGGSLSRLQLGVLERYRNKPLVPTVAFSTMRDLLEAVRQEKVRLTQNHGETYSLFEGCFTTHAAIKKYNRECEGTLLTAESLCAMARVDATEPLRNAWTPVLFNQFHDIMDGASVHDVYDNAAARAERSLDDARTIIRQSAKILVPEGDPSKAAFLTLINPLGSEFTGPVRVDLPKDTQYLEDPDGRLVPIQGSALELIVKDASTLTINSRADPVTFTFVAEGIPPYGSKTYRIHTAAPPEPFPAVAVAEDLRYNFYTIETDTARIRLSRRSGVIGGYYDRRLDRELVAYGYPIPLSHTDITHSEMALNVFQIVDEAPNPMSAWLINDIIRERNLLHQATVSLVESGPVYARFRVEHAFRKSRIREDIILYRSLPRVEFDIHVDWKEKGSEEDGVPQLKVSFGADIRGPRCRTEGPFVVREVPANGAETPTQKFADVSGDGLGMTVLNDSKYGMDALGSRLRVTLLRNPYNPDPETDNGTHHIRLALEPHNGTRTNAELMRAGMGFNRPPVSVISEEPPEPLPPLSITGSRNLVCTALRKAEYSDALLLRLFEANGKRCRASVNFGMPIRNAREVNLLERDTGASTKVEDGAVLLNFRPYEIKTLLVEE